MCNVNPTVRKVKLTQDSLVKLPPKPESHRTGLYGHRGTLKLHTPDWNDGYLQCLKDVSESFGRPCEEGELSV